MKSIKKKGKKKNKNKNRKKSVKEYKDWKGKNKLKGSV